MPENKRRPRIKNRRDRTPVDERWMKRIGARIHDAREARGMLQEELAPMLGFMTSGAISAIELGKAGITPIDLLKLSRILNRPVWWFYGESAWPEDYEDWLRLAEGDEDRARAHYELELSSQRKGE